MTTVSGKQEGKSRAPEMFTRARFEKWYKETYWNFVTAGWDDEQNEYSHYNVQLAWAAYQEGIQILRCVSDQAEFEQLQVQYGKLLDGYRAKRNEVDHLATSLRKSEDSERRLSTSLMGWKIRAQFSESAEEKADAVAAENVVLVAKLANANRDLHLALGGVAYWQTRAASLGAAVATARDTLENV